LERHEERVRASTPDQQSFHVTELTEAERTRILKGYFKTHCFDSYGGLHWIKMLIALGRIPDAALEATNDVIDSLVQEDNQRPATDQPRPPDHRGEVCREVRRPRPCLDAGPNHAPVDKPKQLRLLAKADMRDLEYEERKAGHWATADQRREFARRRQEIEDPLGRGFGSSRPWDCRTRPPPRPS
jgi:hypothetical protein